MSTSVYKVEYTCDCGVDFGNCGAKNAFILKSVNSVDVYILFHVDTHHCNGNSLQNPGIKQVDCFGDNYLSALINVLTKKESNYMDLTEQEKAAIE